MGLKGVNRRQLRVQDGRKLEFGRQPIIPSTLARTVNTYHWIDWVPYFLSAPGFGSDAEEEQWIPVRPLGHGSYGQIGLWQRKSADTGEVLDNLVIKQRELAQDTARLGYTLRDDLGWEAVIQSQLCSMDNSDNILAIRGYKYYPPAENADKGTARLYMEYAK